MGNMRGGSAECTRYSPNTITRSETAMKRKLIAFTTCLSLLFSAVFVANVTAHTVKLADGSGLFDKSRADWFAQGPSEDNIGAVVRNPAGYGEFVWSDNRRDQRVHLPYAT